MFCPLHKEIVVPHGPLVRLRAPIIRYVPRLLIVLCTTALLVFQSACVLTTKTRTRTTPIYEVRRVQVGTQNVTKRERVQTGERQVTTKERVPIAGTGTNGEVEATDYEERLITKTEPVYEERELTVRVPRYEWQRHKVGVNRQKYKTFEINWETLGYAVFFAGILVVLTAVGVFSSLGSSK